MNGAKHTNNFINNFRLAIPMSSKWTRLYDLGDEVNSAGDWLL